MRVLGRAGGGRRFRLASWLGRRVRRVATGTGMLALAVPLAWPSGAGGQHLNVPSASSVRSGVVRLADFVTGDSAPPPKVPVQQTGTAPIGKRVVPVSQTPGPDARDRARAWQGQGPVAAVGRARAARHRDQDVHGPHRPCRGFNAATSTLVASATTAQTDLYKNADGSYTRKVWSAPVNYRTATGSWAPIDDDPGAGLGQPVAGEGELARGELRGLGQRHDAGGRWGPPPARSRCRSRWPGRRTWRRRRPGRRSRTRGSCRTPT